MNFLVFVIGFVGSPRADSVWDYHVRELKRGIEVTDLYAAKRHLAELRRGDPGRYQDASFDLTAAWIAREEGNWQTVYQRNKAVGTNESWSLLERAESLEKMGRPKQALVLLAKKGVVFRKKLQLQQRELQARCLLALNDMPGAVKVLKKLTGSRISTAFRMPAYLRLIELYYALGYKRQCRAVSEKVQTSWPTSDAALYSLFLQETREDPAYLAQPGTWLRFANVCYRNRDFDRSDIYFQKVLDHAKHGKTADRARYYLALTKIKGEDPESALTSFRQAMPELEKGVYAGRAAFQMARSLFLNNHDQETITFVNQYWARSDDPKWRRECIRLLGLALRRSGDLPAFRTLERRLKADRAPAWLFRFYHRNGVIWALQDGRHEDARHHLKRYTKGGLDYYSRLEARLWKGIIHWESGDHGLAVDAWLAVLDLDPNHYFGLVARALVRNNLPAAGAWEQRYPGDNQALGSLNTHVLRQLYYLAPDDASRASIVVHLRKRFDDREPADGEARLLAGSRAAQLAAIGRYDWAVLALRKKRGQTSAYHYLKASWHKIETDLQSSIRHAEILTNGYPRWVPYELLPESVQRLDFPTGYEEIVREKAAARGVDPYLLLAIIREESHFNSLAKSGASARGLMQFIPSTAREIAGEIDGMKSFSLTMLYDPDTAISLGAKYLENLMSTYGGVSLYSIAAYNAGEGAVDRWRSFGEGDPIEFVWDVTYKETRMYCQKVLRAYHHYTRVYEKQALPSVIETPHLSEPSPSVYDRVMN